MGFKKVLFCIPMVGILALFQTGCRKTDQFVEVVDKTLPKTVAIQVMGEAKQKFLVIDKKGIRLEEKVVSVKVGGSGILVSPNNHVLTCAHLFWLDKVTSITVCNNSGTCTAGELLAKEDRTDLALVGSFFDTPTPYVRMADPRKLKVGQDVLAIGSPLGLDFSVSHGIISALNRDDLGVYNMTQSDAFLNPGNSGGGLFNIKGELVGVNSRILPPIRANVFTGLGFSVQTGQIVGFLTRFRQIDKGFPRYGRNYWQGFLHALGFNTGD